MPTLVSAALIATLGVPAPAAAADYVILVAPRDTPAAAYAASKADDQTVFAERRLFRALNRASEIVGAGGAHTVSVLVAAGEYPGQAGLGVWPIPTMSNSEGSLRILGGFNDDFSRRQPFDLLSTLVTQEGRDGAFITVGRRSALKQLVISGFHFDAAPSNRYDARTNSIVKGASRSYPLISLSQLRVSHLVVADNIFINGAHGAFDPAIGGLPGSVVDIQNNLFLNTIKPMKAAALSGGPDVTMNIRHNSFILNWPFNPDPTSSNVGVIELYHADGYGTLLIEGNLFAFNPGGAMQHDWPVDRMGDIVIRDNLFHANGSLFSTTTLEEGVIVGKFGTNPTYRSLDLVTIEDDLDYDVSGNVSMDPEIALAMAPLQAVDSGEIQRENTLVNDLRRILGMNQSGGAVPIANYAPRMVYYDGLPAFPTNANAARYGVQRGAPWEGS